MNVKRIFFYLGLLFLVIFVSFEIAYASVGQNFGGQITKTKETDIQRLEKDHKCTPADVGSSDSNYSTTGSDNSGGGSSSDSGSGNSDSSDKKDSSSSTEWKTIEIRPVGKSPMKYFISSGTKSKTGTTPTVNQLIIGKYSGKVTVTCVRADPPDTQRVELDKITLFGTSRK